MAMGILEFGFVISIDLARTIDSAQECRGERTRLARTKIALLSTSGVSDRRDNRSALSSWRSRHCGWRQRIHGSLAEIAQSIRVIGSLVGKSAEACALVEELTMTLEEMAAENRSLKKRPRVFFEEWPDPLISGIRWTSELIEMRRAGGFVLLKRIARAKLWAFCF